ncbi:PLAC8 motif-containing protein [Sesbania bispinosa]|nr:PLAC8 motif-containing protein [Sesbania bispinosa]
MSEKGAAGSRQYGIEGNQCCDCLVSCICPHITLCQQYRWEGNVQMGSRGVTAAPAVEGGMSR